MIKPTIAQIIAAVADAFNVTPADIIGPYRTTPIANARFATYAALREMGYTHQPTGEGVGRERRASDHGIARSRTIARHDAEYRERLDAVLAKLMAGNVF